MRTYILQEDTPWGKKGEEKDHRFLRVFLTETGIFYLSKLGVLKEKEQHNLPDVEKNQCPHCGEKDILFLNRKHDCPVADLIPEDWEEEFDEQFVAKEGESKVIKMGLSSMWAGTIKDFIRAKKAEWEDSAILSVELRDEEEIKRAKQAGRDEAVEYIKRNASHVIGIKAHSEPDESLYVRLEKKDVPDTGFQIVSQSVLEAARKQ